MIHGIINIYKEKGFTSHDVVAKLRGITGQKKIGHTGTLDPDAVGVLPVCFGKATKLCDMLTDRDKTYEAVLLLGRTTDTQDITGETLKECPADSLTCEQTAECIEGFVGEYAQIPPMYSALKVNGKKLYELAREGKTVERKPRIVTIHQIRILEMDLPRVTMEVSCSKGTYIRTLCHDIGEQLGTGGCMESLIRTKAGPFEIRDSLSLLEVEKLKKEGKLSEAVVPIDGMFAEYQSVVLKSESAPLGYNGNAFFVKDIQTEAMQFGDQEQVRVYDHRDAFIGIYKYLARTREFRIVKMFYSKED